MLRRRFRWLAAGLALAGLAACGGGGGGGRGDGGGAGGGGGAVFSAEYVPLNAGDKRLMRMRGGRTPGAYTSSTLGAAVNVAGYAALELRDETGFLYHVARTPTGLVELPGPGADALSAALGPVEVMRFGLAAGERATLIDRTVNADVDGDGRSDVATVRLEFSVVEFMAITTPAATFSNAARVRSELQLNVNFGGGGSNTLNVTVDEWYVAGVGAVYVITNTRVGSGATEGEIEELVAYKVGGQRSDSVAPTVSSSTPAAGGALATSAPITVRLSEPIDPAGLAGPNGVSLVDDAGRVVAATAALGSSLDELTVTPQGALADGAYTLRWGAAVADWAGNPLGGSGLAFAVDRGAPGLASSVPARGSDEAALTGTVSLVFSEDVVVAGSDAPFIEVSDALSHVVVQRLPATVSGRTVSATLASALVRDTAYTMRSSVALSDIAGNLIAAQATEVAFRTDPGPLARPVPLVSGARVSTVRRGDLDGDGIPDLVFVAEDTASGLPYLGLRPGLVGGGYGPARALQSLADAGTCRAGQLALGDFDGAGRTDVALDCSRALNVYLQGPTGGFTRESPNNGVGSELAALDLEGDGRAELALIGTPSGVGFDLGSDWRVLSRATGAWTTVFTQGWGADYIVHSWGTLGDIDGDGLFDLVFLRRSVSGHYELAWAPRAGASFGAVRSVPLADEAVTLALHDVDGDGRMDALIAAGTGDRRGVHLLRGLGGGSFAAAEVLASGSVPQAIHVGDINGDGRADIVATLDNERVVGVFLQAAMGGFDPMRRFTRSDADAFGPRSLFITDVNGDGLADLVARGDVLLGRGTSQAWPAAAAPGPSALSQRGRAGLLAAPAAARARGGGR